MFEKFIKKITPKNVEQILESKQDQLNNLKEKNESAYITLLNKIFSKVQESAETGLADYGYWVLPDGKEIMVDEFQGHDSLAPNGDNVAAMENGWARIVSAEPEFLVDIEIPLTRKQFQVIVDLLKNHNAFTNYSRFSISTPEIGYDQVHDYRTFISLLRNSVEKPSTEKEIVKEFFEDAIEMVDDTIKQMEKINPKLFGTLIEQEKIKNAEKVLESISSKTALKTRNDILKLARKFTDSSNIVPLSNFESYEGEDSITLKIGIFDKNVKTLKDLNDKIVDLLKSQGWEVDQDNLKKDNIQVKMHKIQKAFKSGAYQNREMPRLGIEINGPKRQIID